MGIGNHLTDTAAPARHSQGDLLVIELIDMIVQEGEHRIGHFPVPQRSADDNGIPPVEILYARIDLGPVSGIDLAALVIGVAIGRLTLRTGIVTVIHHLKQCATTLVGNVLSQRLGHPAIGVINNQGADVGSGRSLTSKTH